MKNRQLGNSGIEVSELGIGLAALGRPAYHTLKHDRDLGPDKSPHALLNNTLATLDQAKKSGISFYDTARSYGRGEEFLNKWLTNSYEPHFTISSKWGYSYVGDWRMDVDVHEVKEHSLKQLKAQYHESLRTLEHRLNIYQIHSVNPESVVLSDNSILDELWKLKASGIKIGLSSTGPEQTAVLQKIPEIVSGSQLLFDTVQVTWNILEQSTNEALDNLNALGVGIIIKEPVANGILTSSNQFEEFTEQMTLLRTLAEKHNCGIDALALARALHKGWNGPVLSGAANPDQLISNVQAADIRLNAADIALLDRLKEDSKDYWNRRKLLPWN